MELPFIKEAIGQLFSKTSCEMYPVVPKDAAPRYRGRIKYDPEKCLGCGMCQRVCAGGAISIGKEELEEGTKITLTFDLGSCTFCSNCADFCPGKCIELTGDYHMIATKEDDLIVTGTHVKPKPVKKAAPAAAPAAAASPSVSPRGDGKPVQDPTKCVYCTICAKKCPQGALEADRANKVWKCNYEECIACGNCANVCPKKAIIC